MRLSTIFVLTIVVCVCVSGQTRAANLSLDKTYAYYTTPPGQTAASPSHYKDDH